MELKYVVGLDIGHSLSGYAFSTGAAPGGIYLNKNWSSQYTAYKTPTALLVRRDDSGMKLLAFGYEAYEEYSRILSEPEKSQSVRLYHHFQDFFGPETEKAGLDGVYVQRKLGNITTSALYHCLSVDKFPYSCCAVINLGANCSHMVLYQNTNTSAATPLSWKEVKFTLCSGSERFKHRLVHMVAECCGWDFVTSYTDKYPALWLELLNHLEQGFSTVTQKSHLVCELTSAFGGEFSDESSPKDIQMSLREVFQKTMETADGVVKKSGVSVAKNGKLIITKERLRSICEPVFQELTKAWQELYSYGQNAAGLEPEVVYLVGGLASNEMVKDHVRAIVGDIRLVIPEQPDICAMKGAVVVGLKFLK